MEHKHDLIVKYLQIMAEQEEMINELSKTNKVLLNKNSELKSQKEMYKNNALEWKREYEALQNINSQYAINIYDLFLVKGL